MKYADLHAHTAESDGTYTAVQLVREAIARGLSAVAIVDHDSVGAIAEALKEAKETNCEIIPGIELTAQQDNQEIHILGYFLDYQQEVLLDELKLVRQNRVERVYKIIENLKESGIELNAQTVFDISGRGTVGRMHIARALVKDGWVSSTSEAFRKYIGDRSPACVLGFRFSPAEAIKLIRDAGGVAVLAHPYILENDGLIAEFARCGLQGLEVYYPEHSQSLINFYLDMAKKLDLLVTGGSDFHGSAKPDIKLGAIKVPLELVEKLRQATKPILNNR
ncbi:MAG: PHP domain-containing protein [Candidatus Omnitrophota bacterium]|nr:PHP domain-containing protein [Candidatus Omnitrophota bacterium]